MSAAPLLELVGLTKTFPVRNAFGRITGEVRAVDGVSLGIDRGEVYGLAGESGSGKSTIARMIMGLTKPSAGDILLDGKNITGESGTRAYGRRVQMVFQTPGSSLNPRRTVGQSIAVPLDAHGFPRAGRAARIAELLEMVQLPADFVSRYPHELSGGQQQRVAIARALVKRPRVLLADEPTGNLDEDTRDEIIGLMERLWRDQNLTMVLVTHDSAVARRAQRLGVMRNGKITIRQDSRSRDSAVGQS